MTIHLLHFVLIFPAKIADLSLVHTGDIKTQRHKDLDRYVVMFQCELPNIRT